MILHSLKLAHFRGVAQFEARDLPVQGLCAITLPDGADAAVLADGLRYALTGTRPGDGVLSPEGGYAFVEAGFCSPTGTRFSVFRGLARRGAEQVSLREEDGPLLHSGGEAVEERLVEILGLPVERWLEVTIPAPPRVAVAVVPRAPPEPARPVEPVPSVDPAVLRAARARVEAAADGLLRSFQAAFLLTGATAQLDQLAALGGRLRCERSDAAIALGRLSSERERVRSRLRRVAEYQALVEQTGPVATTPAERTERPPTFALQASLAVLTAAFFIALVWLLAGREPGLEGLDLKIATSVGLLVSLSSFLLVAGRRSAAVRHTPGGVSERARDEWRDALRSRFRDLEDPDDPALPESLRGRLATIERDMAPSQARLERLDEAIAVFEVEVGRACRALHCPLPEVAEAAGGFREGESLEGIDVALSALGDGIFQACSERDALAAGGAPAPERARSEARAAIEVLAPLFGGSVDDPEASDVLAWDALETPVDATVLARTRETCEVMVQLARSDVMEAAAATEPSGASGGGEASPSIGRRLAEELLGVSDDELAAVVERRLPTALALVTDDQWSMARIDDEGHVELSGSMGTVRLQALPAPIRARLGFGFHVLVEAGRSGLTGGLRLFTGVPPGFTGPADLARSLRRILPQPVQLVLPAQEPTIAAADGIRAADSSSPGRNGRPEGRVGSGGPRHAGRTRAGGEEHDATREPRGTRSD